MSGAIGPSVRMPRNACAAAFQLLFSAAVHYGWRPPVLKVWLDHLNMNEELAKVLTKLVVEVKTEIRFRPTEDGKIVPETTNDYRVKPGTGGG